MSAKPAPSELTAHLGYWLRQVSNHVSHSFARKVELHGVTVAEWVLLRHLLEIEPAAPSRLAESMNVTRGAVSKLADRLIAKSLLLRATDPSDGRAQILSLTPAARALVPKLAKLADANDAACFDALPAKDRAALLRILQSLADIHDLKSPPID